MSKNGETQAKCRTALAYHSVNIPRDAVPDFQRAKSMIAASRPEGKIDSGSAMVVMIRDWLARHQASSVAPTE